jgi:iron complex outermembrane receptor protein
MKWKRWDINVEPYFKLIDNYIYLQSAGPVLTIRGIYPHFNYRSADALFYGLNALAEFKVSDTRVIRLRSDITCARKMSGQRYLPFIPPPSLMIDGLWSKKNRHIRLGVRYVTKQFRTEIDQDFIPAPDAYAVLEMEAGAQIKMSRTACNISFVAQNLTNAKYRDYLNRFRYFSDERGTNIMLRLSFPIINIRSKKVQKSKQEIKQKHI